MTSADGSPAIERIAALLRIQPRELRVLRQFPEAGVDHLHAAVRAAIDVQRRDLDDAFERALGFIPGLLRGRARKLLFPGGGGG